MKGHYYTYQYQYLDLVAPIFHFSLGLFLAFDNSNWLNNNFHLVTGSTDLSLKLASTRTSDLYSIVECYLRLRSRKLSTFQSSPRSSYRWLYPSPQGQWLSERPLAWSDRRSRSYQRTIFLLRIAKTRLGNFLLLAHLNQEFYNDFWDIIWPLYEEIRQNVVSVKQQIGTTLI